MDERLGHFIVTQVLNFMIPITIKSMELFQVTLLNY